MLARGRRSSSIYSSPFGGEEVGFSYEKLLARELNEEGATVLQFAPKVVMTHDCYLERSLSFDPDNGFL
jgi:hypothetical protein